MAEVFRVSDVPERMKARFAGKPDHLTICFWMWALFNAPSDEDYPAYADRILREIADRGFNCVRMDDGAGLICDIRGVPRGPVSWHRYARPYQATRQTSEDGRGMIPERLLIFCKAAERHGIRLILSSWYYMHTNWYLEENINTELFEGLPTVAERIDYFTKEHNRILQLLRKNGLLHVVAFVELFNEFENLKYTLTPEAGKITPEEAAEWRPLLEDAYACLKRENPELLFAWDSPTPWMREDLIPRNADILNYHHYYMWNALYGWLDKSLSTGRLKSEEFPPEIACFLREDRPCREDIVRARSRWGKIRAGFEWTPRMVLFNSLDPAKIPEVEQRISDRFDANCDSFMRKLQEGLDVVMKIRDEVLQGVPIVMGEGTSCCTCDKILFEEHSDAFWKMLEKQSLLLRENGLWGTVVRTGSAPVDISWNMRTGSFRKVNLLFLNGKEERH